MSIFDCTNIGVKSVRLRSQGVIKIVRRSCSLNAEEGRKRVHSVPLLACCHLTRLLLGLSHGPAFGSVFRIVGKFTKSGEYYILTKSRMAFSIRTRRGAGRAIVTNRDLVAQVREEKDFRRLLRKIRLRGTVFNLVVLCN